MGIIGEEIGLSPGGEGIALPPEVDALRLELAKYLEEADRSGQDHAIVRIAFDEGQAARALFLGAKALRRRNPPEELARDTDELLRAVVAAYVRGIAVFRPEIMRGNDQSSVS